MVFGFVVICYRFNEDLSLFIILFFGCLLFGTKFAGNNVATFTGLIRLKTFFHRINQ